jgi:hypothetical protein
VLVDAYGATDKGYVIDWADSQIEASETPCIDLIDISLGNSKSEPELAALLKNLACDTRDLWSIKAAMGLLADRIRSRQLDAKNGISIDFADPRVCCTMMTS